MTPRRILITNNTLGPRAGSELYVRDLATALLDRGHHPVAFSTVLGDVADELRRRTVPVVSDLSQLSVPPDIIHGHHHLETMMALLHFPGTPAVSVCHGWIPWEELPPRFPRVRRHVVVDETCWDRVTSEHGVDPSTVRLLLNFVDLDRFKPRGPLPRTPTRAVVLSQEISDDNILPAIREACRRGGLTLDVVGRAAGSVSDAPEAILPAYDIVFAKARSALEAMAVGAAVVLCSHAGLGPLVTSSEMARLRRFNFGVRTISRVATAEAVEAELARYDAKDAAAVSAWIRADAGRDTVVDAWVRMYDEVIAEHADADPPDVVAESRAAAAYLVSLSAPLKAHGATLRSLDVLREEVAAARTARSALWALEVAYASLRSDHAALMAERDDLTATHRDATTRVGAAEHLRRLAEQVGFAVRRRLP